MIQYHANCFSASSMFTNYGLIQVNIGFTLSNFRTKTVSQMKTLNITQTLINRHHKCNLSLRKTKSEISRNFTPTYIRGFFLRTAFWVCCRQFRVISNLYQRIRLTSWHVVVVVNQSVRWHFVAWLLTVKDWGCQQFNQYCVWSLMSGCSHISNILVYLFLYLYLWLHLAVRHRISNCI